MIFVKSVVNLYKICCKYFTTSKKNKSIQTYRPDESFYVVFFHVFCSFSPRSDQKFNFFEKAPPGERKIEKFVSDKSGARRLKM